MPGRAAKSRGRAFSFFQTRENMTRYLVIGAGGQLGQDLVPKLRGEVIAPGRDRVELTDALGLRQTLDVTAPDIVVNCAAYNFVDRAENEARQAFAVNAIGVGELARWCGEHRSEEHTSELQSRRDLVCRLLLEKKK